MSKLIQPTVRRVVAIDVPIIHDEKCLKNKIRRENLVAGIENRNAREEAASTSCNPDHFTLSLNNLRTIPKRTELRIFAPSARPQARQQRVL